MKNKIAIVRGKFLNRYEMQSYEPLAEEFDITAFGSLFPFHSNFSFSTVKLFSPLDLPNFPYKMQILNRICKDAQYLFGVENGLQGFAIAHTAETYFHFTNQCLIAKRKGYVKKVVVTVWENIPFNNEGIKGRTAFKQQVFREADHFVAVSERAKIALILEGVDSAKITVISPGIDTKLFTPIKKNIPKTKHINLLFVGRLEKNKGIYELLYSLKLLQMDKSLETYTIGLTIIGEGSEKMTIRNLMNRLGLESIIVFKKIAYEMMPAEYRAVDIFIAPSKEDTYWQEQWGMALMEAQASGLPIVTTMSGSIPENVGDAAILVQPGDVLSLKNAIKKLIVDPKLRLNYSRKARERAVKVHDVMIVANKIKNVYEKLF
jgi:glycosyltransferase involved in cell wall biosynthesis